MTDNQNSAADAGQLKRMLEQKEKEVYSIQRIGKALSSTLQLDELLRLIMLEINNLMDAERTTLYVVDYEHGEIWSKIALKSEVKEIRQKIGKGISGHVAASGETINIPDAYDDGRFDPSTDKRTGYRTRSILCMPVWEPLGQEGNRKIIAVIQLLNKREGVFSAEDEDLLETIAAQVAISISNAQLYQRLEKKFTEIDLLYDLEQMLSSVFELPEILVQLLSRTVDHLKARLVLAILPEGERFSVVAVDNQHRLTSRVESTIPPGLLQLIEKPSLEQIRENWAILTEYAQLEADTDPAEQMALFSGLAISESQQGLLIALDIQQGMQQQFEDERKMLELVSQKMARAEELHRLRESLFERERLSAIGQLMSTIVHDLRGPVNTVYGFVDLMQDTMTTEDERSEYGQIIRSELQLTMNMITEVLDFAKGKTSILPRKSAARDLLKQFRPRLEQMCAKHGIELRIENESLAVMHADVDKLNRVFYNLAKNAIEAMGTGGMLSFRIHDLGKKVLFELSDSGPGIPPEIQNRLFDSFVSSGKEGGTGLGLAIVKKIIDEHHGTIEIDSDTGVGATFRVILPILE